MRARLETLGSQLLLIWRPLVVCFCDFFDFPLALALLFPKLYPQLIAGRPYFCRQHRPIVLVLVWVYPSTHKRWRYAFNCTHTHSHTKKDGRFIAKSGKNFLLGNCLSGKVKRFLNIFHHSKPGYRFQSCSPPFDFICSGLGATVVCEILFSTCFCLFATFTLYPLCVCSSWHTGAVRPLLLPYEPEKNGWLLPICQLLFIFPFSSFFATKCKGKHLLFWRPDKNGTFTHTQTL